MPNAPQDAMRTYPSPPSTDTASTAGQQAAAAESVPGQQQPSGSMNQGNSGSAATPTPIPPASPDPSSSVHSRRVTDPRQLPIPATSSDQPGASTSSKSGAGDHDERKDEDEDEGEDGSHDPTVHIMPPPSGGWRAGMLRARQIAETHQRIVESEQRQRQQQGAGLPPSSQPGGNGGVQQSQGPHRLFGSSYPAPPPGSTTNSNVTSDDAWHGSPSSSGRMPSHHSPTYKPSGAPEYWMPDAAHIQLLNERHAKLHSRHVHRHGVGARTTRLASTSARLVEIKDKMLYVSGQPFWIQGICYSPVAIGESVSFDPKGDYFTPDYAYIWQRDLPLIKAMGATTLRIYGWNSKLDHTAFLDAVEAAGLKVLVTYYLGDAKENPVHTVDQRNQIIIDFVEQVNRYRDHPAILMWSFGNELNGAWNGFAKQFSDAHSCWWQAGCAGYSDTNSDCQWQSTCMYYHMLSWINAACRAAKVVTTRPIISGFADVDFLVGPTPWLDKVARFDYVLPDMDAWAVQLYRGWSFGGYFAMYRQESSKPMIVTEYGVDAFNDPCGWPENNQGGCFNLPGDAAGGADDNGHFWGCAGGGDCAKPGVVAQAEWDVRLSHEIMDQYVTNGGILWGGFLMAWTDEYWKGGGTQDLCAYPCNIHDIAWCRGAGQANYRPGGSAMCSWRAHFTCPNWDTNFHDLCGYWLAAAPDNYVNEEWFGITSPSSCGLHKANPDGVDGGYHLDTLYVRQAYISVMQLWTGLSEVDTSHATCQALKPCWQCCLSYSMDELNDGACSRECAIPSLAVGPGSSQASQAARPKMSWRRGGSQDDFITKFGIPIGAVATMLIIAIVASLCLYRRRRKMRRAEARAMGQPLMS